MPDIVLTTLNARYIHASIGLRSLLANLQELEAEAEIIEFTTADRLQDVAEKILALHPRILGIGVYIWNALQVEQLTQIIKILSPSTIVVLGGPEASHLPHRVNLDSADHIVQGEGETSFYRLCRTLLDHSGTADRIIAPILPDINTLHLPYDYYNDEDIQHRTLYVEASRGCPYTCEFCLSSIDKQVRYFDIDCFLDSLQILWQRGARNIKFIDRTFNLNTERVSRILDFFLAKSPPYLIHFEVVPDYFPAPIKQRLSQFQPGTLQLEVGIQTLNGEVAQAIHRKLDMEKLKENLHFLEHQTNAHLHLDLIVGLPGEPLESFGSNLNTLTTLTTGEIQLGVLKKLSGTTINRHDQMHNMLYSPLPPYEILANDLIDFAVMQQFKRFARFWDLLYNSGNFSGSVTLLWQDTDTYSGFADFSSWLYQNTLTTWQISLRRMAELLFHYLVDEKQVSPAVVADSIAADILKVQGRRLPPIIREHTTVPLLKTKQKTAASAGKRQQKHLL